MKLLARLALVSILLSLSASGAIASDVISVPVAAARASSLAVVLRPVDAGSKYLAAEFSRDLIHLLGAGSRLMVAPRGRVLQWEASSVPPAHIGRALSVPAILVGTLQANSETFRLQVELVDVASEKILWSTTLEENLADGSGVPAQIVQSVGLSLAKEFGAPSTARFPQLLPVRRDAWLHYMQARRALDAFTGPSLLEAVREFEQAIQLDPDSVASHAGLATAHLALGYNFENPRVHFEQARRSVNEALRRDATLAEAIIADGALKYFLEWDWDGAARIAREAARLDPSAVETYACFLHGAETTGHFDEALQQVANAHASHPASMVIRSELGCAAYYAGKIGESARDCRLALTDDPENPFLLWGVARALAQAGEFDAAAAELEKAQSKPGGDWTGIVAEFAYVRARQKRGSDALALIEQLQTRAKSEYVDPYLFAMAYVGLGDEAEVFRQLDAAAAVKSTWISSLPVDPKFAALRVDPRFKRLLTVLKLSAG